MWSVDSGTAQSCLLGARFQDLPGHPGPRADTEDPTVRSPAVPDSRQPTDTPHRPPHSLCNCPVSDTGTFKTQQWDFRRQDFLESAPGLGMFVTVTTYNDEVKAPPRFCY